MTSTQDLYSKFLELLEKPVTTESPDNPEMISTIYHNDWVRMLVIRNIDEPNLLTIEIESSLPLRTQGIHENPEDGLQARNVLNGMIDTLQYLLLLQDLGFSLDIIGQDCMWTAYLELEKPPTKEFFDKIRPH